MKDLGGATLLIGVRDNDLAGRNANDLSNLALIHGDPTTQQLHCLHPANTPEPAGSQAALAACRTSILDKVVAALDGLDTTGRPDAAHRTSCLVFLGIRHRVDVSLPTYYVRISDRRCTRSRTAWRNSDRAPDDARVTAVVNWVNLVENDYDESVDGPPTRRTWIAATIPTTCGGPGAFSRHKLPPSCCRSRSIPHRAAMRR